MKYLKIVRDTKVLYCFLLDVGTCFRKIQFILLYPETQKGGGDVKIPYFKAPPGIRDFPEFNEGTKNVYYHFQGISHIWIFQNVCVRGVWNCQSILCVSTTQSRQTARSIWVACSIYFSFLYKLNKEYSCPLVQNMFYLPPIH